MRAVPELAGIDFTSLWTWALLFIRMTGLFTSMPGIGTEQVPETLRILPALIIAACVAATGTTATFPQSLADGGLMAVTEFLLGYVLGAIPAFVMSGLTVAGQVISGSIGLGQANMIDQSLGESVSVLSRLKSQVAILVFLSIDGHHAMLRAASMTAGDLGIGMFRPGMETTTILLNRFIASFELALSISAPVLVTALVTNFVLGLVTKFVPQVNIFIISMPLAIIVGFFIVAATFTGLALHTEYQLSLIDEFAQRVLMANG